MKNEELVGEAIGMDAVIKKDEVLSDEQLDNVTGGAPEYVAYFNAAKAAGIDTSNIRVDSIFGVITTNPTKITRMS